MQDPKERRRYGRIHPDPPLKGMLGDVPIRVMELSVTGARVAHETNLVNTHGVDELSIEWQEHVLYFHCELVRTLVSRLARKPGEKSLYITGMRFNGAGGNSDALLRELIAGYVVRALNEQLANAHGIPPLAAYSYQSGKGTAFRRWELVDGGWRKAETTNPGQPANGFTISAEIDPYQSELLCKAWELCDPAGRRLTQVLAQLSISKAEGIPTRRYEP